MKQQTSIILSRSIAYHRGMSRRISVPFEHLVLYHGEIGVHRGRKVGFRTVFGFRSLYDVPFVKLAKKVKDAYVGKRVPTHSGWPAQHEALRWFVEQGREAIYALKTKPIKVRKRNDDRYYILGGHHRSLALYILGDNEVRASRERH
jgi:ParB-like nuclease domain